jgi:hypothetical protein
VQGFLALLQATALSRAQFEMADLFFSTWLNRPPRVFAADLVELEQHHAFTDSHNVERLNERLRVWDMSCLPFSRAHRKVWQAFGVDVLLRSLAAGDALFDAPAPLRFDLWPRHVS